MIQLQPQFIYTKPPQIQTLTEAFGRPDALVVCDQYTFNLCFPLLYVDVPCVVLPPGEHSKSLASIEQILQAMVKRKMSKSSVLINLGGGVVCDTGGFAASIFQRGIPFINVPTSLMAMADAGYGGKTGINLNHLKNYIGSYQNPEAVFIATDFLPTLPSREMLSGFAEIIKHAIISTFEDWKPYFKHASEFNRLNWLELVKKSNLFKNNIVEQDFKDNSIRKILNFGHTIGHAIESTKLVLNDSITHGEAVAAGMMVELQLSYEVLGLPWQMMNEYQSCIETYFQKINLTEVDIEAIVKLVHQDKKNSNNTVLCSLLNEHGLCTYNIPVADSQIRSALIKYCS